MDWNTCSNTSYYLIIKYLKSVEEPNEIKRNMNPSWIIESERKVKMQNVELQKTVELKEKSMSWSRQK